MATQRHRRQVLLFLIAIILPCVVLVVLGVRLMAQERELAQRRLADERRSTSRQLRQELSARLDRIALEEATALIADPDHQVARDQQSPVVALVARASDGRLELPWEHDPRSARFRRLLDRGEYGRLVSDGERVEIGAHDPDGAVELYDQALAVAGDPAQVAYALLLRARARSAAGRQQEAQRDYGAVLNTSLEVVDEHGVPLALYAATRLLEVKALLEVVVDRMQQMLSNAGWLSPTALYLLGELREDLQASMDASGAAVVGTIGGAIDERRTCTEQAMALQRDFPGLGLGSGGSRVRGTGTPWIPYGSPTWLVGRAAAVAEEGDIIVAVWADTLFALVEGTGVGSRGFAGEIVVASGEAENLEVLGAAFPGLLVHFTSAAEAGETDWGLRRWFYLAALLLVLSVTLFGAYLVSQDVRRELRVAELRSRFVSAVSHELKTPLTAIRMFAETLQLGRSPNPTDQEEYLETIVNESERLTRLLNNVLDFSKIERGKKEYRRTPADLGEIVRRTARAMQYPLEQQHFTLNLDVANELPPVSVDSDAIEQAILNLLSNAMKYSGQSRVIDLRLARSDGYASIEVVDSGVGVEPAEQEKIFEQFHRAPTADNEGIPGTGLGLTLVRHIAEGHGGQVTVQSTRGEGSTFVICLPLEEAAL